MMMAMPIWMMMMKVIKMMRMMRMMMAKIDDDDDAGKVNPVMNKGFCHLMTGLMHHNGPRELLVQGGGSEKAA